MKNKENDITTIFGLTVRELRVEAGYSQEDFAHICKLHRTYIGAIERGEKNVTIVTAKKIAVAFGISLSSLLLNVEKKISNTGATND
ncbi:MAG: helix-turn-helix transcriptional regulator [Anaerolineae bacterium]|nr:helix-turn-helix transcriptional regulator [Anaerolineae bacterium]MDQ7036110.1 helix-turn-helix transcriptional regulator [Anaerolineae bacterium]